MSIVTVGPPADDLGAADSVDGKSEDDLPDEIPEDRLLAPPKLAPPKLAPPKLGEAETAEILESYVGPDQTVRDTMLPPPDGQPMGRDNHLWIDRQRGHVIADGYVSMRLGVLEMFACPAGTKEHESVVATLARSKEVHAALLAVGAAPGTPVQFVPKFVPATGQVIRVWVCWRDRAGVFRTVDARKWIQQVESNEPMDAEWIFAGSGFWKDPSDGREYYQADGGDMICVSNFSTAMMDVSIASSAESAHLMYKPATDLIPERGTPVRLVLVPIPNPTDADKGDAEARRLREKETAAKNDDPPTQRVLPPQKVVPPAKTESPDQASGTARSDGEELPRSQ